MAEAPKSLTLDIEYVLLGTKENTRPGDVVKSVHDGTIGWVIHHSMDGVRVRLTDEGPRPAFSWFKYGEYHIQDSRLTTEQREALVAEARAQELDNAFEHKPQDHTYGNEWCKKNCGEDPAYPGWRATNFQTPEEWQADQGQENIDGDRRTGVIPGVTDVVTNPLPVEVGDDGEYRFTDKVEHYNGHPSGVECQEIIRECKDPMVAFAMKHLWRSQWGNKPGAPKTLDLKKAVEYLQLELAREEGQARL